MTSRQESDRQNNIILSQFCRGDVINILLARLSELSLIGEKMESDIWKSNFSHTITHGLDKSC